MATSTNIQDYYTYLKNEVSGRRGTVFAGGRWRTGAMVPSATWGDVVTAYNDLLEKASPLPIPSRDIPENYWRAVKQFQANSPMSKAIDTYGFIMGPAQVLRQWDQWYPFNSDFWWYAKDFALYRNSLGAIEPWFSRAKAALTETIKERKKEIDDGAAEASWLWTLWKWRLPVAVGVGGLVVYSKFGGSIKRRLK